MNITGTDQKCTSMRVPAELLPAKKEYKVEVTLLTLEERQRTKMGE